MTAKRRTFRGRRRTLKGGDCCDYEKFKPNNGCGTLAPYDKDASHDARHDARHDKEYDLYDIPTEDHDTFVNRRDLKDSNCNYRLIENVFINLNNEPRERNQIKLRIKYHALKHMDMFRAYKDKCNSQYEFITELIELLSTETAKSSIIDLIKQGIKPDGTFGYDDKDGNKKTSFNYDCPDMFSGEDRTIVTIALDTTEHNLNNFYVFTVKPFHKSKGQSSNTIFTLRKVDINERTFSKYNIRSDIEAINGLADENQLKKEFYKTKNTIKEIALRYGLNIISSFRSERGRIFLTKMAELYSTKNGLDCNNLTYKELFGFINTRPKLRIAKTIYEIDMTNPPTTVAVIRRDPLPRPPVDWGSNTSQLVSKISSDSKSVVEDLPDLVREVSNPADLIGDYVPIDRDIPPTNIEDNLKNMYYQVYEAWYQNEPWYADEKRRRDTETLSTSRKLDPHERPRDAPSVGDPGGGAATEDAGSIKQSVPTLATVYLKIKNTAKIPTLDDAEKKIIAENMRSIKDKLLKEKDQTLQDFALDAHLNELISVKKAKNQQAAAQSRSTEAAAKKKGAKVAKGGKRITKKRKTRHTTKTRRRRAT
jgi:hypothetical protein